MKEELLRAAPVRQAKGQRAWFSYPIIAALVTLFIVLPVAAMVYFREEIQQAQGYGYLGVFLIGVLCGVSIFPAPTLWLVFTLGHVLNPVYVGLVAGLGGAIGGISVYLTGAGVITIWSKLLADEQAIQRRLGLGDGNKTPHSSFWLRSKAFYNRSVGWLSGGGGSWALFITAALIISPFYPAGLAAGSLRIGLLRFFLITWAGKTVRYLIVAFAGNLGLQFILRWIGA